MRLTEELLDAIANPARRVELYDDELPTFGVRISPGGDKTFFVLYTVRGERRKRRFTIGRYGKTAWRLKLPRGAPKDELTARDEARRIVGLVAKGHDPQGERMGERGALRFEDFAARYLQAARRKKRTWMQDLRQIGGFKVRFDDEIEVDTARTGKLLPRWRGRTVTSIRKRDVLEVIEADVDAAPIAANRLRALLSRMFRWGAEQDLVDHNPILGTKPPANERPGQRVLTEAEIGEAYHRCIGGGAVGDIVRLLILLWLRRAEAVELELPELHEGVRIWEIPAERMKNKRPHIVPLPPAAQGIISARIAMHPGGRRLFLNRAGEPVHPDSVSDFIAELAKMMGRQPFTQRDLRRSCTTHGGRIGIDRDIRARLLSHTDPTVTGRHYDRYDYLEEKRDALELWAKNVLAWAHRAQASVSEAAAVASAPALGRRRRSASPAMSAD